jgi:CRP/FNR family transcriptional regulator, cyclic AMP receptor protein
MAIRQDFQTGPDGTRIYPLLRQTTLRSFLNDDQLRDLQGFCERLDRRPGVTLYRQGEQADALYVVGKGSVELRARPPGRRVYRTVEVVGEGCTVGDEASMGEEQYLTSARTRDQSELLRFSAASLERLMDTRHDIAIGLLRCGGSCLVRMIRRSAILTQAPAEVALVLLLRELSEQDGPVVKITHAQLAGLLHLSRETVSRLLGQMAASGSIELSRGAVKLTS